MQSRLAMVSRADSALAWLQAWAAAERGRFALFLPVFLTAGAVTFLTLTIEPPAWLGAAMLAASLAACAIRPLRRGVVVLVALALGFAAAQAAVLAAPPLLVVPSRAVIVTGIV